MCSLLEDFAWDHRADISQGWAPQTLLEAGVPYEAIFESLYTMREAGVSAITCRELRALVPDIVVKLVC